MAATVEGSSGRRCDAFGEVEFDAEVRGGMRQLATISCCTIVGRRARKSVADHPLPVPLDLAVISRYPSPSGSG
jgi:hypothetical protein